MANRINNKNSNKWHALDVQEVLKRLGASENGLSSDEALRRLEKVGPNSLVVEEGINPFRLLIRQVHNPLIYLLIFAAILSIFIGHTIDVIVIAGVIILNTILGFFQEWRAEKALSALRRMASPHAKVLRDGNPKLIDASEVVPGDILFLETGDKVAADARLIWVNELQVDESALTGESLPVAKIVEVLKPDTPLADRKNMVFTSTNVTGGRGLAVVVATGMNTEIGKIAAQVSATKREETPLQKRMHKLSIFIGVGAIILSSFVFVLGLLSGYKIVEMLMFSVAVAVSAIPEGLPAVISVTLALGVQRMASRKALIRRLPAVETLGSVTVICSDKTGTITKNQMTVKKIWAGGQIYEVTGDGYVPEGEIRKEGGEKLEKLPEDLKKFLEIGLYCNNAVLRKKEGQWIVEGNPTEGALIVVAMKAGLEENQEKKKRLSEIPFSSEAKYMATLHAGEKNGKSIVYIKGAPDRIIGFCSHVLVNGEPVELDETLRKEIERISENFASEALRVMAGAYKEFENKNELQRSDVERGLIFAGLWGMIDPPREESAEAVRQAKEAGVKVVMITGDHAVTALAIAKKVGIVENGKVITGKEIDEMENPRVAKAALEYGVFARVTPGHKLKILRSLKDHGQIVAMTGDGVNDAPALKGADIGIAMGIAGTEVAKEASDMILLDDNFATIVKAIEEGRRIYDNLRRVVFYLISTNLGEILTFMAALAFGLGLPLTAVMVLWVNLVTDGACTIPLGVEPAHKDILKRPPRDPKEFIINRVVLMRMALLTPIMAAGTLGLFWFAKQNGSLEYARTVAFTTLAAFQWFQALNARSTFNSIFSVGLFTNRWVLLGIGLAIILQISVVHFPLGQMLFKTTGLGFSDWMLIVLVSSSIWVADELYKLIGIYRKLTKKKITLFSEPS